MSATETKTGSASDEAVDTNLPWHRNSTMKISITPKDFHIEFVTHRKGKVPSIFPPKGQDNTEDNEKTTTVTVTGDLGIEIARQADGQGIEHHDSDDKEDWADVANQVMGNIGGVIAGGIAGGHRGGCFGGTQIVPNFGDDNPIPPHARTEPTDKPDAA